MDSIIPQDAIPQKLCCTCKQYFPATPEYFHQSYQKRNPDGLNMRCKECTNEQTRRSRANPNKKRHEKYPEGYKRCAECKELKPATHEHFNAAGDRSKDNLTYVCKDCWKPYVKRLAEAQAAKPQEPMRTCTGPCGRTLPTTREFFSYEAQGLRRKCKDCRKKEADANYKLNEEARKAHRRAYMGANREAIRAYDRNRRALKKNAPGFHTAEDIKRQYERQKGHCYYCSKKLGTGRRSYHVDHIVPLNRGGSNWPDNLVIACPYCNQSKQDKLLHEWIAGGRLL